MMGDRSESPSVLQNSDIQPLDTTRAADNAQPNITERRYDILRLANELDIDGRRHILKLIISDGYERVISTVKDGSAISLTELSDSLISRIHAYITYKLKGDT